MGNISIIEFIVYGIICYSSLIILASLVTKPEIPATRSYGSMRLLFMIPGLICAGVLASSGVNIVMPNNTFTNITKDLNSSTVWSQSTNSTSVIVLQNPVWITIHVLFFLVFFIYILSQVLFILTKHD